LVLGVGREEGERRGKARGERKHAQEGRRMRVMNPYGGFLPVFILPVKAAVHRARRLVPEPRTRLSQTLTKGPRPH
jgi:hypothetical protein